MIGETFLVVAAANVLGAAIGAAVGEWIERRRSWRASSCAVPVAVLPLVIDPLTLSTADRFHAAVVDANAQRAHMEDRHADRPVGLAALDT